MPARSVSTLKFTARSPRTMAKRTTLAMNPADDHHQQRQGEPRQEVAHLAQEHAQRLEHHVEAVHDYFLPLGSTVRSAAPRLPASAASPCSGMRSQSGRLSSS